MRIAICDDDKQFLEEMDRKLRRYPFVSTVDPYIGIDSFFAEVDERNRFDLVLMDIDWGAENTGMEYAEKLYRIAPHIPVIYVTGYNDRFSQHILLKKTNLTGYLTKPVQDELLEKYLEKALNQHAEEQNLSFQQRGSTITINVRSIIYIESVNHVSLIHTDHTTYKLYKKLRDLLPQLPAPFIQCHKSYIVNLYWVQRLEQGRILLKNGEEVLVSRSFKTRTREAVFNFMGLQI